MGGYSHWEARDNGDSSGSGERWSDSRYVWKIEPIGLADGLDVGYEIKSPREKRIVSMNGDREAVGGR